MIIRTFGKLHAQNQSSKRISILQLQLFINKNRIKDHRELVNRMKEYFGSLRKASIFYNLHWHTFNRLCQPPVIKKKLVKDVQVYIKTFYNIQNILQPVPSIYCKGQHYLTKSLEESYSLYCEDSMKMSKKCVSFLTFC